MDRTDLRDALRVDSLVKSHPSSAGRIEVLRGVSLAFPRGRMTAVMGPSGSGKSTLLQCAAGLEKPTAGRIILGDTDISTASNRALNKIHRERIGLTSPASSPN